MSYSFTVRKPTKAEAKEAALAEMAKVVELQPVHAKDRDAVDACLRSFVDVLGDDNDQTDVFVSAWGSISTTDPVTKAQVSVNAERVPRVAT